MKSAFYQQLQNKKKQSVAISIAKPMTYLFSLNYRPEGHFSFLILCENSFVLSDLFDVRWEKSSPNSFNITKCLQECVAEKVQEELCLQNSYS